MAKLTKQNIEKINKLATLFPRTVKVLFIRFENGRFGAIVPFAGGNIRTEAKSLSELLFMINDAIRAVLKVPKKYWPYVPEYMMTCKLAQELELWPASRRRKSIGSLSILRQEAGSSV